MSGNAGHKIRTLEERLWAKVDIGSPDECWNWHGAGRGSIWTGERNELPARVIWRTRFGPIPEGQRVCHRCDNPSCCNPSHLFLGSPKENTQDAVSKGRMPHGSKHYAAKLDEDAVTKIMGEVRSGVPQRQIALRLGLHVMTVSNIVTGKTWKHIQREAA